MNNQFTNGLINSNTLFNDGYRWWTYHALEAHKLRNVLNDLPKRDPDRS